MKSVWTGEGKDDQSPDCAEIWLPYFKQGDDFARYLEESASIEDALESHAEAMDAAAQILRNIKAVVAGREVRFGAMTHGIWIDAAPDIIETLIKNELAHECPSCDEDEN